MRETRRRSLLVAIVAAVAVSCGTPPPTGPVRPSTPLRPSATDPAAIAAAITPEALGATLDKLAAIATANGGTRRTGGPGDAATVQYLEGLLAELGYAVAADPFVAPVFADGTGDELVVLGDGGRTFELRRDFGPFMFSPAGSVEARVVDLGWDPAARQPDGRGCREEDYAGRDVSGAIVLVRPGPCYRRDAVLNAQAAGAVGLVSAIPWAGLGEVRRATLIDPGGLHIPAIAADRVAGAALAAAARSGALVRLVTTGSTADGTLRSVVAELPGVDRSRVVVVGAHLDSSMDGPGINDDGSGVAAVVALARAFAGTTPRATIRFAFWAAEESGLKGSARYVQEHAPLSSERTIAYLNVDMIASPNGFRGVYDEASAAAGSEEIRDLFARDLDAQGLAWEGVDLGGGSDHSPFAGAGIPTGGLFTGASELVTGAQAGRYGREAGQPADACYHLACDGRDNLDADLMLELARSLARVTAELATR
jgi:aminopeptidase Y